MTIISKLLPIFIPASCLVLTACQTVTPAQTATAPQSGIIFYNQTGFKGGAFILNQNVTDFSILDDVPSYGQINDSAYSIKAFGRWQVCQHSHFGGECRVVEGDVPSLGSLTQSISSVRYLGPGRNPSTVTLSNNMQLPNPLSKQVNRQKSNIENRTTNEINNRVDGVVNRVLDNIFK